MTANYEKVEPRMIVVYPTGQLSARDRKTLKEAGIVAVEADSPSKVVTVLPIAPISLPIQADDMTMALLHAVATGGEGQKFVSELYRRAIAAEKAREPMAREVPP